MAIKDVGLGGTGSASYATLGTLIAEFSPVKFQNQINQQSPLLSSGLLPKVEPDGEEYIVTLDGGNKASVGWVQDKGRLPIGNATLPVKARALPSFLVGTISLGMGAAMAKLTGSQVVTKLDEEMDQTTSNLAQAMGRGIHGQLVSPQAGATWSGTAADATVSINFLDVAMFRPGSAYDWTNATDIKSWTVQCTSVTPAAVGANTEDVAGTVVFTNNVVNASNSTVPTLSTTTVLTTDAFRQRGATAQDTGVASGSVALADIGQRISSFDDIAGSAANATAAFMGVTTAQFPGWTGRYRNLNGAYSQEAVVKFLGGLRTYSGLMPDVVVMHPIVAAAHTMSVGIHGVVFGVGSGSPAISAARPMPTDKSFDKFGNLYEDSGLRVGGATIVQDPNCPAARVTAYAKSATKLAVWKELGPDQEAGDPILLGRTFYDRGVQLSGGYQLVTHKRASVGVLDNITGL